MVNFLYKKGTPYGKWWKYHLINFTNSAIFTLHMRTATYVELFMIAIILELLIQNSIILRE
jgi:hypothetical protein